MAVVIPFETRRREPRGDRARPPAGGAEILFFTGVRYERMPEPAERPGQPRRARRAGLASKGKLLAAAGPAV